MRTVRGGSVCARGLWIALAGLVVTGVVWAQDIPSGTDCWTTEAITTVEIPALPEGFFGSKSGTPSDARPIQVIGVEGLPLPDGVVTGTCNCPLVPQVELIWVDQHGNPVEPNDLHKVKQQEVVVAGVPQDIDTCVQRNGNVTFSGIGNPETVQIELIELSLKSIAPITVTYGAQPTSQFDVFITESGTQTVGQMTLTPQASSGSDWAGDVDNDSLFVDYQITFEDVAMVQTTPNPLSPMSLEFVDTPGTFNTNVDQTVPALNPWAVVLLVVAIAMASIFMLRRRQVRPARS